MALGIERLRDVVYAVPVGFFHADAAGNLTWATPRFCELAGIAQSEALGRGWLEATNPRDRDALERRWNAAIAAAVPAESTCGSRAQAAQFTRAC